VTDEHVPGGTNTSGIVMPGATQTSGDAAPETGQTPAGVRYRPRDRVLAVRYPTEPDVVREVEIRGLARTLGLEPHVPFDYTRFSGGRNLPTREILLGQGNYAIRVPRGHWFVVHPRPGKPLLEVLSDTDFRATFTGPARSAEGERELADAVAAEAHFHLGRQVELRYVDAGDHTTGMWAHPAMQAVIAGIRAQHWAPTRAPAGRGSARPGRSGSTPGRPR
jgi:hypothetical protein